MSDFVNDFISKTKKQFLKYNKYIVDNDWSGLNTSVAKKKSARTKKVEEDENKTSKRQEFDIQNDLAKGILDRVKYFVKKTENIKRTKPALNFIKESLDIIDIHTNRVDSYINTIDISEIDNIDLRSDEIAFHNHIFKQVSSIQDTISGLNVSFEEEAPASEIEFLNNAKAPLSLHKVLSPLFPQINKELEKMGIDFESDPGNELLMYMDNIPKWDTEVHYWQQDKDTLQFYVDEFKKLEDGIIIDGVYISGWAYYHMNVFTTSIPHKVWNEKRQDYVSEDRKINPPLRDSDWMLFENRDRQERQKILFMFVAATRRAAKTTAEASMLGHAATIGKGELLCAGASAKDLGQVAKNFKIDAEYKNPAFAIPNLTSDWEKQVTMGIKRKSGKNITLSTLHIINTDSGNNKEIFAGFTPDIVVLDEAMKEKFLEALEGLIPAMRGSDGQIRCFGMLSGTGGTSALSADGLKVLAAPELNDVLPMQWDILERGIGEKFISWSEDKGAFGTFIPGQCRVDMPKIESTLADYLGKPDAKNLKKIKIKVTDWEKALEEINNRRDKVQGDKIKYQKEVLYAPLKPQDIKSSGALNRFPVMEAKAHKEYLLETGLWDRRRDVFKDTMGNIRVEISKKPLAEFPHRGGFMDAPFLIFEDPPIEKPKYGTYTAGFDDYAVDDSNTSSLASFYVMKNEILGDPFSMKIVASITFRPEKHSEVYEKWLLLMEMYNLEQTCFGENFNYNIKDYLERRHLADKYLAPSLDFSQSFSIPNNGKRRSGWNPSTSKKFLFDLFVDYCNEDFEFEQEDGNIKILKGVQRIDDIGLLEEIIQYADNLNVDRIISAMGCTSYGFFLRSSFRWKPLTYRPKQYSEEPKKELPKRERSFYSGSSRNRSFYGKGRR